MIVDAFVTNTSNELIKQYCQRTIYKKSMGYDYPIHLELLYVIRKKFRVKSI